jgi:hypothetical protein
MGSNLRIYFRSFQKVIFEGNFIRAVFIQLKRLVDIYSEFNGASRKLSKSIDETKSRFEVTKKVVNSNSEKGRSNFINLVR